MRARRMRRRLFNLFAFTILAFAIYLVTSKEEPVQPTDQTASAVKSPKAATDNISH